MQMIEARDDTVGPRRGLAAFPDGPAAPQQEGAVQVRAPDPSSQYDNRRAHGPAARSSHRPDARSSIQAQLSALFGASLFGEWKSPEFLLATGDFEAGLRGGTSLRHVAFALALLPLILGAVLLVRTGLQHAEDDRRGHIAEELQDFLRHGDLQRAEARRRMLLPDGSTADPADPHTPLVLRTQATLYRYGDADPARLRGFSALERLSVEDSPDALVASALLKSRTERIALHKTLEAMDQDGNLDPETPFLLATALDAAGDMQGAAHWYDRANELGPDHLPHLAAEVDFCLRVGRRRHALELLEQMRQRNAASPWTRLAWLHGDPERQLPEDDELASAAPVVRAEMVLVLAQRALEKEAVVEAGSALSRAVEDVSHQAPFVLDWVERLLVSGRTEAARHIVRSPGWPAQRPEARAAEGRLSLAEGRVRQARRQLIQLWREGWRHPQASLALVQTLIKAPLKGLPASSILDALVQRFPERLDFQIEHARRLIDAGKLRQAQDLLEERTASIVSHAGPFLSARAYLQLGRIAFADRRYGVATRLLKRAAGHDPDNPDVKAMRSKLDSPNKPAARKKSRRSRRFQSKSRRKSQRKGRRHVTREGW